MPIRIRESNGSLLVQKDLIQSQNNLIYKWAPIVKNQLKANTEQFVAGKEEPMVLRNHGKQVEQKLELSLKAKIGKTYGLADYVGFSMERHGVFLHKGTGRGYSSKGKAFASRITDKPSNWPRQREAVNWFNPTVDYYVKILADELAQVNANAVLNATRLKLK